MKKRFSKLNDENFLAYIGKIKKVPLLTFEEELDLSKRIQNGDDGARQILIESNLRLVIKVARGYFAPGVALMDLIQEGNMGLMKAVEKYDHEKQVRFSTYAAWWIRQTISRFLTDKRRTIRLPHRKEEILRKIHRAYHSLSQMYKRQPKYSEIAADIGVPEDDVEFILSLSNDTLSIEADWLNNENPAAIEHLADNTYSPELAFLKKSSREDTMRALGSLKDRERNVLIHRYDLNGRAGNTLKTISRRMGLSAETIRQIELRALEKLRNDADFLRPYLEVS